MRAVRRPAGGGFLQDLLHPPKGQLLQHLQDPHCADLSTDAAVDKHYLPVNPGHTQPFRAVAGDRDCMHLIFQ